MGFLFGLALLFLLFVLFGLALEILFHRLFKLLFVVIEVGKLGLFQRLWLFLPASQALQFGLVFLELLRLLAVLFAQLTNPPRGVLFLFLGLRFANGGG